jgi:hypothetical protein
MVVGYTALVGRRSTTGPTRYEIVLRGRLGARLESALEGFEVVPSARGTTCLVGWVTDQAALQGTLRRVADFGLELVSVREIPDDAHLGAPGGTRD